MIIDFHTHAFPDTLAVRAIPTLAANSGLVPFHDGTVAGLLERMDVSGIDRSVVLSIATSAHQEPSISRFAVSLLKNERLIPFGSVFPGSDTWEQTLDFLAENGIRGIKLHPEYQHFDLDSDAACAIYEKCGKLGLLVSFHSGHDAAFTTPIHTGPDRINRVCALFPQTTFIAAHFGGYDLWTETAQKLAFHENLYLDTAMTRTAAKADPDDLRHLADKMGVEHLLLGSDSPWEDPAESVCGVRELGLSESDTQKILSGNALRLLNLPV